MLFKWCFFMLVLLDASVDFRIAGSRGAEVGSREGGAEDWGLIQWLHKWIWLIEGASDPDWCTAGAPLIGEGGEWWSESGGRRKGEHGPRRKGTSAAKLLTWQGSRQTLIRVKKVASLIESRRRAAELSLYIATLGKKSAQSTRV